MSEYKMSTESECYNCGYWYQSEEEEYPSCHASEQDAPCNYDDDGHFNGGY